MVMVGFGARRRADALAGQGRGEMGQGASFWVRRLGQGLFVLWGVASLVFLALRAAPGDPVDAILGDQAPEKDKEALRQCLGLDQPLWAQYGGFLKEVFGGTFGELCGQPGVLVRDKLLEALPWTVELSATALLLAALISIPMGVYSATRRGTWVDSSLTVVSLLGVSIPAFWLGPMLLLALSLALQHLPDARGALEPVRILWLPALTLAAALAARLTRMTRASVLDVLGQDYIRTARAKGLPERWVLLKHALRNAMLPVTTLLGLQFGALLGGSVIIEKIFARPGLGTLLLEAVETRNYRIVQGCVLVIALSYVLINLAVDVLYTRIDPRVEAP